MGTASVFFYLFKSYEIASVAAEIEGKSVIFLTPSVPLLNQDLPNLLIFEPIKVMRLARHFTEMTFCK